MILQPTTIFFKKIALIVFFNPFCLFKYLLVKALLTLVIGIDQNVLMGHPHYILVLCLNNVTV